MALPADTLKKLVGKAGILSEDEFDRYEREAERRGLPVERILIAEGKITQTYLNELISKFLNIPIVDFEKEPPDPKLIEALPETIARQRQAVVFGKDEEKKVFKVAMADPTDIETVNFLREYLKGEIEPYLSPPESLRFAFRIYKKRVSEEFEKQITDKIARLATSLKEIGVSVLESIPLAQLFDTILDYAATLNASDIYFQPQEDSLLVRFRVDGVVRDIVTMDKVINEGIVARTKILSALRIDEHLKPQDGRFRFKSSDMDFDVRTAVMPTFFGEKVTLRLLSTSSAFLTFEELGMQKETADKLRKELSKPYGMILSSGPTGSGKTTTIYAMLALLNKPEVHIATIEDPIEYVIARVSQTQVNPQAGITFATGLRSMLRHSPDILVVGEVRDSETADISINASLTGHLLISTIHTNDAPTAVPRLLDLGVPPFLISATLNAVIAQRLVRKICRNCVESSTVPEGVRKVVEEELARRKRKRALPKVLYHGRGCSVCGFTGYAGRVGIFEIFVVDENTRNLITSGTITVDILRQAADAQGMQTMFEDGLSKVETGVTTVEEILRAIRE